MKLTNYFNRVVQLCTLLLLCTLTAQAQTVVLTEDFSGTSTDPADYGFVVTGTTADGMSATVADGKLTLVSGNNSKDRGYDAKRTFAPITAGYEVTMTCTWATGNATGTNAYSRLVLSDGTNQALNINYSGQSKELSVNGTKVASGVNRGETHNVSVTLDTRTQKITALSVGTVYTAEEPILFSSSDCTTITTFQFSNWTRASWANTSSIDDICITSKELEEIAPDYVEPISKVEITGGGNMTFGPTPDEAFSNAYSVVITGDLGTTITESNLSEKVTDFKVVWDIEGFKTGNDTEGQYCDSYGSFSVNNEGKVATTFDLRNVPMNFFGKLTATVTYNGTTTKAEKYVIALGDLSRQTNQVLPLAGYPKDFSAYDDALVGYQVTGETYGNSNDLIVGGWSVAGSDGSKSAVLSKDADGTKYIRFTGGTAKKSHVITQTITAPTSQLIFAQKMRFNSAGAVVTLTSGYPIWSANRYTCPVSLNFDGTNLKLNDTPLTDGDAAAQIATGTWYLIVLSADKSSNLCYAQVYNTEGALVAQSGTVAWTVDSDPTYFSIGMGNSNTGSVDFASCEAFTPMADADSYSLSADKTTLSIPNKDTATLTANLSDVNGYAITQQAVWSVVEEDMQQGILITPDAADSHKAVVSLTETAEAGTATVQVSIGGNTKTLELTVTSSSESIKFTKSTTSLSIPMDESETATADFVAVVVDGEGKALQRSVTLAAYEKDGTTPLTNTDAISFDAAAGILSVKASALPTQIVVRATGKNSNDEELSKSVRVNIHGMKFDFGYADDDAVAEGFTVVGGTTAYNVTAGYGIKSGTAVAGGTASATDATSDYLEGAFEFDFKVVDGEFYTVEITYQGVLTTGYINSDLAGYELGSSETMTTATYTIPATTDVIDLRIADNGDAKARIAQITVTKQAKRQKRGKPVVHHIGDSTSANNGSWAYRLSKMSDSYTELFELCTFQNNGAGGRNLSTYYTEGKLASVLRDIYPDDIVMFGNNGTNGMGSSFEADVNYYLDAAEALGAKIIINSYTPHGVVAGYTNGYDAATHTFDSYRKDSYETVVRRVAEERAASDENYLGFVEIGKNADAAFNGYVADYAMNGYASADAAAQAIISCFTDHNHYSNGTLACNLMLNGYGEVKGIVGQLISILNKKVTGIEPLQVPAVAEDRHEGIYTLSGQRVTAPVRRGLYIVNGRKVFVR